MADTRDQPELSPTSLETAYQEMGLDDAAPTIPPVVVTSTVVTEAQLTQYGLSEQNTGMLTTDGIASVTKLPLSPGLTSFPALPAPPVTVTSPTSHTEPSTSTAVQTARVTTAGGIELVGMAAIEHMYTLQHVDVTEMVAVKEEFEESCAVPFSYPYVKTTHVMEGALDVICIHSDDEPEHVTTAAQQDSVADTSNADKPDITVVAQLTQQVAAITPDTPAEANIDTIDTVAELTGMDTSPNEHSAAAQDSHLTELSSVIGDKTIKNADPTVSSALVFTPVPDLHVLAAAAALRPTIFHDAPLSTTMASDGISGITLPITNASFRPAVFTDAALSSTLASTEVIHVTLPITQPDVNLDLALLDSNAGPAAISLAALLIIAGDDATTEPLAAADIITRADAGQAVGAVTVSRSSLAGSQKAKEAGPPAESSKSPLPATPEADDIFDVRWPVTTKQPAASPHLARPLKHRHAVSGQQMQEEELLLSSDNSSSCSELMMSSLTTSVKGLRKRVIVKSPPRTDAQVIKPGLELPNTFIHDTKERRSRSAPQPDKKQSGGVRKKLPLPSRTQSTPANVSRAMKIRPSQPRLAHKSDRAKPEQLMHQSSPSSHKSPSSSLKLPKAKKLGKLASSLATLPERSQMFAWLHSHEPAAEQQATAVEQRDTAASSSQPVDADMPALSQDETAIDDHEMDTRVSSPDAVLARDLAASDAAALLQHQPATFDEFENRERCEQFKRLFPPMIPFTVQRATKNDVTDEQNFVVRPNNKKGRQRTDAGDKTYCRFCPHLTVNRDKHPYCPKCMYVNGVAQCPTDCDFCEPSRKARVPRNKRLKAIAIMANHELDTAEMMPAFVETQNDTIIYRGLIDQEWFAKRFAASHPKFTGRTTPRIVDMMILRLAEEPLEIAGICTTPYEKVQRSCRKWIGRVPSPLEQRYRRRLLTGCYNLVTQRPDTPNAAAWLRAALLVAYTLNHQRVHMKELLFVLEAQYHDLRAPDLGHAPVTEVVGERHSSDSGSESSTSHPQRSGAKHASHRQATVKRKAGTKRSSGPVKKLKLDPAVSTKVLAAQLLQEQAWLKALEASKGIVPATETYETVELDDRLPSRLSTHVEDALEFCTNVSTKKSAQFQLPRCPSAAGPGWSLPPRVRVIDTPDRLLTEIEDRQVEFMRQLKKDMPLYQLRSRPLPRTSKLSNVNMHAYNAPLGRIPVLGAKYPAYQLPGSATREYNHDKLAPIFDGDLRYVEQTGKLTLNQHGALLELLRNLTIHVNALPEVTPAISQLLAASSATAWDAATSNVETCFHTVMMRRYQLVDTTVPATEAQVLSLMQGLSLGASTLAEETTLASDWGTHTSMYLNLQDELAQAAAKESTTSLDSAEAAPAPVASTSAMTPLP